MLRWHRRALLMCQTHDAFYVKYDCSHVLFLRDPNYFLFNVFISQFQIIIQGKIPHYVCKCCNILIVDCIWISKHKSANASTRGSGLI